MINKLFFIILVSLLVLNIQIIRGQSSVELLNMPGKSNFILITSNISLLKTLDKGVSPLIYRGFGVGGELGYWSKSDKRIINTNISVLKGNQSSGVINDLGYYQTTNIGVAFDYLFKLTDSSFINPYFGPYFDYQINMRLNEQMFNAAFNYDIINSLGASVYFDKSIKQRGFKIKLFKWFYNFNPHRITFVYNLKVPLLIAYLRKPYTSVSNVVDGSNKPFGTDSICVEFVGKQILIKSNIGVLYHLQNDNIIKFAYTWQYYKIDPGYNPIQSIRHFFEIGIMIKLNNHSAKWN